jgi:hypothetical protein
MRQVILAGIVEKSLPGSAENNRIAIYEPDLVDAQFALTGDGGLVIKGARGLGRERRAPSSEPDARGDTGERQESHVFRAKVLSGSVTPISPVHGKCG